MNMRFNSSRYFFLRASAALVGSIILLALLLDFVLLQTTYYGNDTQANNYQVEFNLIETILAQDDNPQVIFNAQQANLEAAIGVPVSLQQRRDFSGLEAEFSNIPAGEIITLFDNSDNAIHYRMISGSDYLLAIGPVAINTDASAIYPGLITAVYYLLIGLLILLWLRPFYQDLENLSNTAQRFGENDFTPRVQVAHGSRILPVAHAFNAMAERIEYLVSSHRELTNAVSHELRTPLARFKFSMEILSRTTDKEKKELYLSNMKQDVEELEELIDEMLSYAKLNEQNLLLELLDMDIRPWLQNLMHAYDEEKITFTLSFHPESQQQFRATFNPDLMARAINNILRNCLRYAQSTIAISVTQQDGKTQIIVQDDGNGIAQDKLDSIFEPFSRGDTSRDRQSGGYGLGLAIAARIIQRHQGKITASNNTNDNSDDNSIKGAKFILSW